MRRDSALLFALLCVLVAVVGSLTLTAHAEEPVPVPDPATVLVNDPAVSAKLDNLQQTLDVIAAALAPQEDEDAEPEPTPEPAPDYTAQLDKIESALAKIDENTTPATPETPVPVFDKPFDEYTTTEVLLLCIGIVLVFAFIGFVFFRR